MRYDHITDLLIAERSRYEDRVRRILHNVMHDDRKTADLIATDGPKKRGPYKTHTKTTTAKLAGTKLRWQQTPQGKATLRKIAKAYWRKRRAEKGQDL